MPTKRELLNYPQLRVGIPVPHNTAASLTHLLQHNVEDIKLSLEDMRVEGCTLVVSGHIKAYPEWIDVEAQEARDSEMEEMRQFWAQYMENERKKFGLDNPATLAEIKRLNEMALDGTLKYADTDCWSQEAWEYNERLESEILKELREIEWQQHQL